MTPDERLRINVSLWQRFLGHEGHEIEPYSPKSSDAYCFQCAASLPDLTTDGNAMLALKAALTATEHDIELHFAPGEPPLCIAFIRSVEGTMFRAEADDAPAALALAADQLPEDDHADKPPADPLRWARENDRKAHG